MFDKESMWLDGMDTLDTSVGLGAAMVAQNILKKQSNSDVEAFQLHNIVPRHLGTGMACTDHNGKFRDDDSSCTDQVDQLHRLRNMGVTYFSPVIQANSHLPTSGHFYGRPIQPEATDLHISILTGHEKVGYAEDYEQLDVLKIKCGEKDATRDKKSFSATFSVDENGILRVFAQTDVEKKSLDVGHSMYRSRTQDEINMGAQLLQDRGAVKPRSVVKVDLTDSDMLERQLRELLKDEMYDEAKSLLSEATQYVKVRLKQAKNGEFSGKDDGWWAKMTERFWTANAPFTPVGCYKDMTNRDLPTEVMGGLSAQECANACSARGFNYMGRQAKNQCWCGNSYGKHGPASGCACGSNKEPGKGYNCVFQLDEGFGARTVEELENMMLFLQWKLFQHQYLYDDKALDGGSQNDPKKPPKHKPGLCKNEVLTNEKRLNEFGRMVERRSKTKIDHEWWAKWLGIELYECTSAALKAAWRTKNLADHPDKQPACQTAGANSREGECGCAHRITQRINAVYEMLKPLCINV